MPSFSIRHPYLIIVFCLFVCVLGLTSLLQMPVDMFPPINIPVVLVATFYSGMPPQQIEADITDTFERFFTLAGGVDHMESRSLPGVSLIKIFFQPGTDANADVTQISNLAMADLRRLPQGTLSQLITAFGRTQQFVKSSNLHARAQQENVVTARADVLLQVDQCYFGVLRAQPLLRVAQQTVSERRLVSNQVTQMAANQLKSQLDVTFANVDLAQSQLLLIQAQNNLQASYADLTRALGFADQRTYSLAEQSQTPAPPPDLPRLIQQAMMNRPELISQQFEVNSAQAFATGERDLWFPTISVVGTAGLIPFHTTVNANGLHDQYAAAGFNVNIPIFNWHSFGALRNEAEARALAQQQNLRDLQDRIVRDVNKAWLDANSGYQRLSVLQQLLDHATQALNLAQARYQLGLSSIVELTQAQLNLTQAQIEQVNETYDYQTQLSALNYQIGNLR